MEQESQISTENQQENVVSKQESAEVNEIEPSTLKVSIIDKSDTDGQF